MIFSFCPSPQERIEVDVLWCQHPPVGGWRDDCSLASQLQVCAGRFRGLVDASIGADDLAAFLGQLRRLHRNSHGTAELTGIDGQFTLRLKGDPKGGIELRGEVADQAGFDSRLRFTWQLDRNRLGETIRELEQVTSQYPAQAL